MTAGIAILGSARENGNTEKVLRAVLGKEPVKLVSLRNHTIDFYDYDRPGIEDDFLGIAESLVASPRIVFATPVYWYAMSGHLKVFFDRFTDLITLRKDLGRSLVGKPVSLVTSSTEAQLPPGFEVPFQASCDYLKMRYEGAFHGWCVHAAAPQEDVLAAARAFGEELFGRPSSNA